MSLLKRAVSGVSRRDSLSTPSEDLIAAFGGQPSYSGKIVTVANSLTLIPVYRAVNLLSGAIGSLPLEVFRGSRFTKAPEASRPWSLLHDRPNECMAADECWALVQAHLLTWGNAFIWKERGGDGRIANLWPIDPRRVQVGRGPNRKPAYLIQTYAITPPGEDYFTDGPSILADETEIIHIRGLSADGLIGYSPIQLAKQPLGAMMAQEEFGGRFWANDATPGVVLVHPNKLTPEGAQKLKALWDNNHRGGRNRNNSAVLGESIKIEQMTMPLDDAQFVEIAKMSRTDVALLFGIPPYMLAGETGDGMTYSNTEYQSLDFLKWTARHWMTRIEKSLTWDPDLMPSKWFAKFNADEILRGSMTERYTAYAMAPHLLVDEVREMDDREALPDGKGQVLAKTIAAPKGADEPVQDEPLDDQPTPGPDEPGLDETAPVAPATTGGNK